MKETPIYSENAAFQKFEVLKTNRNKRYRYGEFFVEGVRNLKEAIQNGWQISSFLYTKSEPLSDWAKGVLKTVKTEENFVLTPALMAKLSGKTDTSELMAIVKMRPDTLEALPKPKCPLYALFDRPSNRGNLGTVIRSCEALGVDGLILTGHAVDLYDPEVVVSTMGSFFNLPVVRVQDTAVLADFFTQCRAEFPDFQLVGTTAHKEHPLESVNFTRPTLLMIGNETDGLCRAFKEACDVLTTIPMSENSYASSLNVGCAATVLFYEAGRQRRQKN